MTATGEIISLVALGESLASQPQIRTAVSLMARRAKANGVAFDPVEANRTVAGMPKRAVGALIDRLSLALPGIDGDHDPRHGP